MVLNFVDVYQYHLPPKNSLLNSTHNFNFEIYLQFFILCDVYIFQQKYISYVQVCECLLEFLSK